MKKSKLCSAVQAPSNVTGRMYRIIRGNIPAVFFPPLHFVSITPDRYTCFPLISVPEREKYYKIDRNLISDPVRPKVVTPISSKIYRLNEMNFCFFFSNLPRELFHSSKRKRKRAVSKKLVAHAYTELRMDENKNVFDCDGKLLGDELCDAAGGGP